MLASLPPGQSTYQTEVALPVGEDTTATICLTLEYDAPQRVLEDICLYACAHALLWITQERVLEAADQAIDATVAFVGSVGGKVRQVFDDATAAAKRLLGK